MAQGIVPARGPWEYRRSAITALAQGQFQRGDLVTSGIGRLASLFTSSNNTFFLGVATHDSLNSFPAGFATIAIPLPGCTAYVDTLVTEARSNLSFGEAGSIVSANGRTSTFSKLNTSVWSRTVQIVTDNQPLNSADSRIEVSFIQGSALMYSLSSASLLV
jgi:hypothetical protein